MSRTDEDAAAHGLTEAEACTRHERRLAGLPTCAGVAIGPVYRTIEQPAQITRSKIHAADIPAETARLEAAILQSRRQLLKLRSRVSVLPEESQGEIAPLLDAYLQMLGPSRLVRGARQRIQERLVSAETAVMEEANAVAEALIALADAAPPGPDGAGPQR